MRGKRGKCWKLRIGEVEYGKKELEKKTKNRKICRRRRDSNMVL